MILSPSRLSEAQHSLVLDASVMINLLGTGEPAKILTVLDRRIILEAYALGEVTIDPSTHASPEDILTALVSSKLIHLERLSSQGFDRFLSLTGAGFQAGLGDGEAATIAHAVENGVAAVLDDRKATRVARSNFPQLFIFNSLDLLSHKNILQDFGEETLGNLVYYALRHARMRVPPNFLDWVVGLIGEDRARECPSLKWPGK